MRFIKDDVKLKYQSLIVGMEQAHLVLKFILTNIYSVVNKKHQKMHKYTHNINLNMYNIHNFILLTNDKK